MTLPQCFPLILSTLFFVYSPLVLSAKFLVGPGMPYSKPSEAAKVAQHGDIIEIEARTYKNDVAIFTQDNLTIRGVGGRPHLLSVDKAAQGKGIWVIKGNNTVIENIEFSGANVPDQNGAGIRQEGRNLTVRNCYFHDNQNGILTGHDKDSNIVVENSEFAFNGAGDGESHNIYIGRVNSFTLKHSYSHHANIGHLVKSRARINHIYYNRLMDERNGNSSYVVDLPLGGIAYVVGNLMQQSIFTDNPNMIAFAAEGAKYKGQQLYVVNNTMVDDKGTGAFVRVSASKARVMLINNLMIGESRVLHGRGKRLTNLVLKKPGFFNTKGPGLLDLENFDYRLKKEAKAINGGTNPGSVNGINLIPAFQYVHKAKQEARPSDGKIDIGAYEYSAN